MINRNWRCKSPVYLEWLLDTDEVANNKKKEKKNDTKSTNKNTKHNR